MEEYCQIRSKSGKLIRFRMNAAQRRLAQYVARCWHNKIPVKLWIPKARQEGVSTFWQLLTLAMAELFPGYQCALVAHVESSSIEIFAKAKTVLRNLKDWPVRLLNDSAGEIRWTDDSALFACTIKAGDALLKGYTLQAIHWSEAANFADAGLDVGSTVASAQPALNQNELTIEVYESTAKGKDAFFHAGCEAARDPSSGSEYGLVFLPWFLMAEYSMTWEKYRNQFLQRGKEDPGPEFVPTFEEEQLRRKLKAVKVNPGEEDWKYQIDLTDEQLIWRRNEMQKPWCRGRLDLFQRYFPAFYEECFSASANCFFRSDDIEYYRTHSKEPYSQGSMKDGATRPVFLSTPGGATKIWKYPEPGTAYVIGADPGGESRTADPCAAYVLKRDTHEVVAAIHGHMEWDAFSDQLYLLGWLYNWAELAVENNVSRAVVKRLHRKNYPNLYYAIDDVTAEGSKTVPGFNTNRRTRPELLDIIDKAVRSRALRNPDPGFSNEMETFVWVPKTTNPKEGTYKATGRNHDDRIMSLGIGLMLCPEPFEEFNFETPKTKTRTDLIREFLFAKDDSEEYTPPLNLARSLDAAR